MTLTCHTAICITFKHIFEVLCMVVGGFAANQGGSAERTFMLLFGWGRPSTLSQLVSGEGWPTARLASQSDAVRVSLRLGSFVLVGGEAADDQAPKRPLADPSYTVPFIIRCYSILWPSSRI